MSPFIALLLAVVPAAPNVPNVAVTGFSVVDLSAERAEFYTEHFADRLADQGLRVVTPREISALLGMERQRTLLGCEEASSCLIEMANALGVDGVVLGTVAKVGAEFQINLKIIASSNGRRLAAHSAKVGSEGAIVDALTQAASTMAPQLNASLGRTSAAATGGVRAWWWLPATVGVLAVAGGTVGLVVAENSRARLVSGEQLEPTTATEVFESAKTARTLGWVGVGVGAIAVGTAVGFLLAGGSSASSVTPVATLSPDGASIGLVGRLP